MPTISREYHAHAGRYQPGGNSCDYIVVHNTGNSASALAEARNQQNNFSRPAGAHYFLDGGGVIYQLLDDTDTAWAVGAWSGARQLISNFESISIEVCSDGVEFTDAEIEELTWLVQLLMERHDIPARNVVRHWDCHTGHKECPAWYVPQDRWNELHNTITEGDGLTVNASEIIEQWYNGIDGNSGLLNNVYDTNRRVTALETKIDELANSTWAFDNEGQPPSGADNAWKKFTDLKGDVDNLNSKVGKLDKKLDAILKALG